MGVRFWMHKFAAIEVFKVIVTYRDLIELIAWFVVTFSFTTQIANNVSNPIPAFMTAVESVEPEYANNVYGKLHGFLEENYLNS